jgi:threonine/homoserine/homoserine lactone efflux protein
MADLFASGRIIDIILIMVLVEIALLALARRLTKGVPRLARLLPNLAAGFLLLLSVRAAMTDAPWPLIALPLGLALLAHIIDLRGRWER